MEDPDADATPNLSVIRYDSNRDIVLSHADSVVVLDPETKQLVPLSRHQNVENRSRRQELCPTCQRPWQSQASGGPHHVGPTAPTDEHNFITNDYFHMLARSLPNSAQPSPPPSPRRRLAQPVRQTRSGQSHLATSVTPSAPRPPDAEFVASTPAPPESTRISSSAFAQDYFTKFFTVEKELGRGGRGVVLLVQHNLDGVPLGRFACKRVPIGDDHSWLEKVLVEVQLLTQLSHQNLVSYRHVWLEDYQINAFSPTVPCAFILQQYCNGGDLHNYICGDARTATTTQHIKERFRRKSKGEADLPALAQNEPKRLSFEEIYPFFRDITAGLLCLHENGFVHRDLKPSNCLLHQVGHEIRILVSDFGEAQYAYVARKSTGATGTISYCAPEVLQKLDNDGPFGNFTFKSDIFSLGMILHFLCFANLPYKASDILHEDREDVDKLRAEIAGWEGFNDQKRLRPDLPPELYAFLKRLLSSNPDQRPSAKDVNQGVTTGKLSDTFPGMGARRRSSSRDAPEELTPSKRIQKLDTPTQGNSPTRQGPVNGRRLVPGLQAFRNHPRSRSRERVRKPRSKLSVDTAIDDSPDEEHDEDENHDTPASSDLSPIAGPDSERESLLSSSIVLRPRPYVTSALPSPTHNETQPILPSSPDRKQQLLLPSPYRPPSSSIVRVLTLLISSSTLRALILVTKLLSTLQPCVSEGMNATIVYPLLMLAVIEFTLSPDLYRLWTAALFLIVHSLTLGLALSNSALCASRLRNEGPWEGAWEG